MADPNALDVETSAPETARPELLLQNGDRLGRWQIRGLLGRGAQGIVYEAEDSGDGQRAALKVLRDAESGNTQAGAEALAREAEILAAVSHPHLVAARGLEAIDGRSVLILEPIDGECLAERLKHSDRPFTEDALVVLLRGLAEALQAVHEAGYLHRDVKPGNVYLRDDGSPILVDFNAASRMDEPAEESDDGVSMVTSHYAPIEQYQTDGREGPWTDLYGLAALAYRIVTGRPPPPAPARAAGEDLPPARDVAKGRYSAVLLAAIDRGLALDPDGRPAAMGDWINLLEWSQRQRREEPAPPSPPVVTADPALPTAPLDDLPPTEKVTRMPITLRAEDAPEGIRLRADARAPREARKRGGALGFVALATLLAVIGWGGWEGYLRYIKSDWWVDPSGAGDVLSIAQATARARDGATIHLAAGVYQESVVLARPLVLAGPENVEEQAIIEPAVGPCLVATADGASVRNLMLRRPAIDGEAAAAGGACLELAGSALIEDSEISSASGPAVVIRDGADPALSRVTVSGAEGAGLVVEGGARGNIAESTIRGTTKTGILVRSGARPNVTGSLIEGTGQAGLLVTGGGEGRYEGNEIRAAGASAVEIRGGANPELLDNRLTGAKEAGLYVHDGGGRFAGNRIADNGMSGVVVGAGGAPELTGNEISNNAEHGLAILAGGGGRIADNTISDNKGHGIVRSSEATSEIGENALTGNKTPQSRSGRLEAP